MQVTSPSFLEAQPIPYEFSCQGENVNPHLEISGVPENAVSLALIVEDPDAPHGTWTHWVLFNLDPRQSSILENLEKSGDIELGTNSYGNQKWDGPCPPSGTHRYFFKVFALNIKLSPSAPLNSEELYAAIQDHILDEATLMGTYEKVN